MVTKPKWTLIKKNECFLFRKLFAQCTQNNKIYLFKIEEFTHQFNCITNSDEKINLFDYNNSLGIYFFKKKFKKKKSRR